MFWTPKLLGKIAAIINDAITGLTVSLYGDKTVDPEVIERLRKEGLIDELPDATEQAYLYGMAMERGDDVEDMGAEEFAAHVAKNPLPLSDYEKQAIALAKQRAGQYCRGLGNKVNLETGAVAIEADGKLRQQMRQEIKDATAQRIAERQSIKEMRSNLGWKTGDWTRDFDRIAATESHSAMQEGVAAQLREDNKRDPKVAKLCSPGCCDRCEELFTEGGRPRIFRLSELEQNGTNVGRRMADWQPVVGVVHPNCRCELVEVPDGAEFDRNNMLVFPTRKADPQRNIVHVTPNVAARTSPAGDRNPQGISGGSAAAYMFTPPQKPAAHDLATNKKVSLKLLRVPARAPVKKEKERLVGINQGPRDTRSAAPLPFREAIDSAIEQDAKANRRRLKERVERQFGAQDDVAAAINPPAPQRVRRQPV